MLACLKKNETELVKPLKLIKIIGDLKCWRPCNLKYRRLCDLTVGAIPIVMPTVKSPLTILPFLEKRWRSTGTAVEVPLLALRHQ